MFTVPALASEHRGRVEVRLDPKRGRCLHAARPYEQLGVMTTELVHAISLSPTALHTHCAACALPLPVSRKRCAACRTVRYCVLDCQRWHWPLHRLECAALRRFWQAVSADDVNEHDTHRLLFIGRLLLAHGHIEESNGKGELPTVLEEMRTTLPLVRLLSTAGQLLTPDLEPLPDEARQLLADHVFTHITGRNTTATPAQQAVVEDWNRRLNTNTFDLEDGIGLSLAATLSLANHDCEPNSVQLPHGRRLVLGARRAVAAGEELTISYLTENELAEPVAARRLYLRARYGFECECRRCVQESSTKGARS